jgi:hypothetical protein
MVQMMVRTSIFKIFSFKISTLYVVHGGEGGIRTHDTVAGIPVFETGLFNHSSTSPQSEIRQGVDHAARALSLWFAAITENAARCNSPCVDVLTIRIRTV